MISLADVLTENDVVFDVHAPDIASLARIVLDRTLPPRGFSQSDIAEFSAAIADRERLSPALCGAVAIPHARDTRLESFVAAVAVNDHGLVEGSALPRLMIAFLSPASRRQEHLMFLSDLARMARDASAMNAIASARTPSDVLAAIRHCSETRSASSS